jgi:hypothetical protein
MGISQAISRAGKYVIEKKLRLECYLTCGLRNVGNLRSKAGKDFIA